MKRSIGLHIHKTKFHPGVAHRHWDSTAPFSVRLAVLQRRLLPERRIGPLTWQLLQRQVIHVAMSP